MRVSLPILALLSTAAAFDEWRVTQRFATPLRFHENEDPNSVPDPLFGKGYLTTTQGKYLRNKQTDMAVTPGGVNPLDF